MTRNKYRVSIGMPVYNAGKYLQKTVDALLSQSYENFELILSDNASTDNTEEICRIYARTDHRIRYYRSEMNMGAAWNFNYVFGLSVGEYFKWAAADDLCAPELLQRCVDVLECHPEVVVCYAKTRIIDEHDVVLQDYHDDLHLPMKSPRERFVKLMRSLRLCNAVFGVMRRDILGKTPLIGNYIGSDICLLAELSLYGKFFEVPEYLFFRRLHPGASSHKRSNVHQMEFFDPKRKEKIVLPWCRRRYENFNSVKRSPIRLHEKLYLYCYLIFNTIRCGKKYAAELEIAFKQVLFKLWIKLFRFTSGRMKNQINTF